MTEFHNDGKISAAEITAIWKEILLPEMKTISVAVFIDMMRQAFLMLKDGLAPGAWPGKLVLDWKSPSVTVMYDAQQCLPAFDPLWQTKAEPLTLPDVDLTAKETRNFAKKLNEFLSDAMPGFVLGLLTNGVILRSDKNGKEDIFISPDSKAWQIIQALPEAERQTKAQELAAGDEFSLIKASGTVDTPMGKQSVCVSLVFQIIPLTLDQQRGSAYYQIVARLDFTEGDPSAWPEEDRQKLFDGLLKCFNEKTFELVKQKVEKTEEDFKKEVKRLIKHSRPIKYETVKKPKALQDSEAATVTAIMNWHDMTPSLFNCTLQELQTFCDQSNFAQLANSYGFLTDAILLYLKRFTDQKTTAVSIGRFTPTAGNMNTKLDEIIIIDDTMQNFCAAAGITNPKERRQLIEEIKSQQVFTDRLVQAREKRCSLNSKKLHGLSIYFCPR